MEAALSFEITLTIYQSSRRHVLEDLNLQSGSYLSLKHIEIKPAASFPLSFSLLKHFVEGAPLSAVRMSLMIALVPTKPLAFLSCSALLSFCGSWQLRKYVGFLAAVTQIHSLQGQMSPNILHFLPRCKAHFHAANTLLVFLQRLAVLHCTVYNQVVLHNNKQCLSQPVSVYLGEVSATC